MNHYTVKKKNTFALGFGGHGLVSCLFDFGWGCSIAHMW